MATIRDSILSRWAPDPKHFLEVEFLASAFFDWYTANYDVQIALDESGECVWTLERALSTMPNIRAIIPEKDKAWTCPYGLSLWAQVLEPMVKEREEQAMNAILDLVKTTHRLGLKLDRVGMSDAGVYGCDVLINGTWREVLDFLKE
ncbi:hypothetical protein RUND412_004313 [Rhizina undulata]